MTILSNGHQWKFSEFLDNKNYSFDKKQILSSLSEKEIDDAYSSISRWEGYAPTPLVSLNKLSKELNLNKIYYKDESKRFDLKSFKALGGAYAVEKVTQGNKDIVVATATAGNHGRSVAWGARRLGLKCKIFISEFVSDSHDKAVQDDIMEAVEDVTLSMGGSFSAEHGIGVTKLPSMRRRKNKAALQVMRAIKHSLDPNNIMNPGKVVPAAD